MEKTKNMRSSEKITKAVNLAKEAKEEKVMEAKESIETRLNQLRDELRDFYDKTNQALGDAKRKTESSIKEKPFLTVAGSFTAGILVGWLLSRKKDS